MRYLLAILLLFPLFSVAQNNISTQSTVTFIDSIALLQNYPREHNGSVNVRGYHSPGDGGGGLFLWVDTSVMNPVPGMVISVTGISTGRWKRIYITFGAYPLEWFGGQRSSNINTDTVTTNTLALRAAVQWIYGQQYPNYNLTLNNGGNQSTGGYIYMRAGFWRVTDSINILQGVGIRGDDKMGTVIFADMENGHSRQASYRSLFTCYGGGSGGTSFPLVITNSFGDNQFYNLTITSSYAVGGNTTPYHWTMKNAFELRNGFYHMQDININSADSNGVYSFSLINSFFLRVKIDNCGQNAWYMTKDPNAPTNPTTGSSWNTCYFRTSRRGDGWFCDGPIISSNHIGCIYENNGIEDSTGYGFHSLGDSTFNGGRLGWAHYTQQMNIIGGDFERNTAGKMNIDWANIFMTGTIRYTGQPSGNLSDWFISNSLWTINTSQFQSNVNPVTGVPAIIIRSNDSTRSWLDINLPNLTISNIKFIDSPGTVHTYTWMPYLTLRCVGSGGIGRIGYEGFGTSMEGNSVTASSLANTDTSSFITPNISGLLTKKHIYPSTIGAVYNANNGVKDSVGIVSLDTAYNNQLANGSINYKGYFPAGGVANQGYGDYRLQVGVDGYTQLHLFTSGVASGAVNNWWHEEWLYDSTDNIATRMENDRGAVNLVQYLFTGTKGINRGIPDLTQGGVGNFGGPFAAFKGTYQTSIALAATCNTGDGFYVGMRTDKTNAARIFDVDTSGLVQILRLPAQANITALPQQVVFLQDSTDHWGNVLSGLKSGYLDTTFYSKRTVYVSSGAGINVNGSSAATNAVTGYGAVNNTGQVADFLISSSAYSSGSNPGIGASYATVLGNGIALASIGNTPINFQTNSLLRGYFAGSGTLVLNNGMNLYGMSTGAATDSALTVLNGVVRKVSNSGTYILNQTGLQTGASFNIDGSGAAATFVGNTFTAEQQGGTGGGQNNGFQTSGVKVAGVTWVAHTNPGNIRWMDMIIDSNGIFHGRLIDSTLTTYNDFMTFTRTGTTPTTTAFQGVAGSIAASTIPMGYDTVSKQIVKGWNLASSLMIIPPGNPTVTVGAGAGSGGSATITAHSARFFQVTLVTGGSGTNLGTLFTINFPNAWAQSPIGIWSWGYNGSSVTQTSIGWALKTNSTSQMEFDAVNTSPGTSSTYIINISCGY